MEEQHGHHESHAHEAHAHAHHEGGKKKKELVINVRVALIIAGIAIIGAILYTGRGLLIVATVDGQPITRIAVISELEKRTGKAVVDMLVMRKLIQNEVRKQGVVVSAETVDAELKKISDGVASQGGTLEAVLLGQGMTLADLREQIVIQKEIEALIADKVAVSDEEVATYITENKIKIPVGQEEMIKEQIKDGLKQKKMSDEGSKYIESLKGSATINYWKTY